MKELLIQILKDKEANKPRSNQKQIGPSELGGCRRKVWYRLNDQIETNDNELKLAAIMGTAIHTEIEKALTTADPTGKKYVVETEVEYGGMKAHIDLWLPETGDVVDWKTVKVKNLNYFPTKQQRWQVQVYGYLLDKSGVGKPRNVNLVAIARDGDERDVKVHTEAYDPKIAEEALDWLAAIKESQDAPEPEREENYCKFYCKYFDATGEIGCSGIKKDWVKERGVVIEDAELDKQALLYMQIEQQIKALNAEKESIKTSLEGFTGTTFSGVEVVWSSLAGRKQVDAKEVEKLLGFVPYIQGQESVRLTVKQTGGK